MTMKRIKNLSICIRMALIGASRKLRALQSGGAPVPRTCQIPEIKSLYDRLGLGMRSGQFVEIGGFDGETFSNSSFLADQGWTGLYVEPIPSLAMRIRFRHFLNRVNVETVGIAEQVGETTITNMGQLSSMNADTIKIYSNLNWAAKAFSKAKQDVISTDKLENVFSKHKIPYDFELLIIDVEGSEEGIIQQMTSSRYRPKIVIIELVDKHPDFSSSRAIVESHMRVREVMKNSGYEICYEDSVNSVFAKS